MQLKMRGMYTETINIQKNIREGVKFLQVSTDEVYGALGKTGMFVETMPLLPNSPYSALRPVLIYWCGLIMKLMACR